MRDLENAKMNEESLKQAIRDERHTSCIGSNYNYLPKKSITYLMKMSVCNLCIMSTNNKNSDNSMFENKSIMKEGTPDNKSIGTKGHQNLESFVNRIDIDDLKS